MIDVENFWSLFNVVANSFKVLSVAGAESARLARLLSTSVLVYVVASLALVPIKFVIDVEKFWSFINAFANSFKD